MSDTLLEDLRAQIASRRAVLVVGSGVSIASTQNDPAASWVGLLKLGIQRCVDLDSTLAGEWQERAMADVTSTRIDDLLAGASKVGRTLRRQGEWPRWLADAVGKLRLIRPELIDAIGSLNAPILTTNYDDLADRRLQRHPITWRDTADQISFARLESCDTILHIHGFWRQPDSVILDGGDYERVLGNPLTQTGLHTLGEAWSLVFVGCGDGLADPNFEQFLDWLGTVLKGARHRHFRLERVADVARRQQWHTERGHLVRVLPYGETHDDLPLFVGSLQSATPLQIQGPADPLPGHVSIRPTLRAGEYMRLQENGRSAVRQLIALASQLGWTSIAAHGAELSETLEQDLYRVAIAGRSRAGKSSMLNALVGRVICPVERVITTAIPIVVGPGETEAATVTFEPKGREPLHFDGPITADMLAPYADQRHNANNAKKVDRIEVRLGHEVLDLGVEYVDIPGFDDPSGRIWSSTNEVLGRAHALVLVFDVSTYESGGFALDKATRELMESAQQRGCPVLVVCNKADKLSQSDQVGAAKHLLEEFERFGLLAALPRPPFFLSARNAIEARGRSEALPRPFAAFEEALWEQLWNTESVGFRRLHRVFDALRVADEEATALIRIRYAKGPERDLLRKAVARCRQEAARIRASSAHDTEQLRGMAAHAIEEACAAYARQIVNRVAATAGTKMPTVSATIEALQPEMTKRCQSVLDQIEPTAKSKYASADSAISQSLDDLREQVGLSPYAKQAREALEALSGWARAIAPPGSGSGARRMRVLAAGGGTTATIGFAIGGPVGWFLAGAIGLGVSAVVDHFTDNVETQEKLQERVENHAGKAFASFAQDVDQALVSAANRLDRRIQEHAQPFLTDLDRRLETIREPTSDELRLHGEMRKATAAALELLGTLLGSGISVE